MIHDSFNDIIPQIESIPIAVVPASAVAIAPGLTEKTKKLKL